MSSVFNLFFENTLDKHLITIYNNKMMKLSRTQRREKYAIIQETARHRPELTLQELADLFGIKSRSHLFWILKKGENNGLAQQPE